MRPRGWSPALIGGLVVAWYIAVLLLWAIQPLSEEVYVGTDQTVSPPARVSVTLECNSLFSAESRGADLPTLQPQPPGMPPLGFPREPCEFARDDARYALVVDTLFLVVALGAIGWWSRRQRPRSGVPPRLATAG